MAERQFEISKRAFIRKSSMALLLGSLIPIWVFILWDYFSTIGDQSYYSAPVSLLETQLLCIPIFGYQLPAYLVSGIIGITLVKRGWIKSAMATYWGVGISGWIVSALLYSILLSGILRGTDETTIQALGFSLGLGLPSLLLYLVFLFPKSTE
jgi:hypothetical protein